MEEAGNERLQDVRSERVSHFLTSCIVMSQTCGKAADHAPI